MAKRLDDPCPVARALNVVGDRWTLLILRDLFRDGPHRFQGFMDSLAGIAPNTLSARLKALEADGIVARRFYAEHPPRAEYLLTKKGEKLAPILKALYDWGRRHAPKG